MTWRQSCSSMAPGLRLLVAHGQMDEGQLEATMLAFNDGEADLLVCTTIVESGLDIPRVNTILVEGAHRFGLAQLYQLRGRVGRSGVQAHAWLFYPNEEKLTPAARSRLRAIQEFVQLGSGYQLAMRDMEIRGVGNLLGVEQSGQMEAIGFDLYMEMLQECLAEIRGQDIPQVEDTQVDLRVPAFLPGVWIADGNEKMAAYRAAANCQSPEALLALAAAWSDPLWPTARSGADPAGNSWNSRSWPSVVAVSRIHPEKANTYSGHTPAGTGLPPSAQGIAPAPAWSPDLPGRGRDAPGSLPGAWDPFPHPSSSPPSWNGSRPWPANCRGWSRRRFRRT